MKISEPGIYEMTREQYDADPCPTPSLNASTARVLLEQSPRHAFMQHPRLGAQAEPQAHKFDLGQAAHAMLLRGGEGIGVVPFDDYRKKEAQERRDEILSCGGYPVLQEQFDRVEAMTSSLMRQIDSHEASYLFRRGKAEHVICWQEGSIWCRAMLDWIDDTMTVIGDYKTTGASANPNDWVRTGFDMRIDLQVSWYSRGVQALTGSRPDFLYVVQETTAPYAMSVIRLSKMAVDFADKEMDRAGTQWWWCLDQNRWPGYPARVAEISPPPWHEARQLEREIAREELGGDIELLQQLNEWQAS